MNSRYTNRLPTLFTTNFTLGARTAGDVESLDRPMRGTGQPTLESRISAGLLSRLYEMARPVEIQASDFRLEVQMQKHSF